MGAWRDESEKVRGISTSRRKRDIVTNTLSYQTSLGSQHFHPDANTSHASHDQDREFRGY